MDRNSDEYKKFKSEYEAKEQYRKDHPEEYPWFVYFQFGWHNMTYMSDAEVEEAVKFYKGMFESHDDKGNKTWKRFGRQPIYMVRSRGAESEV